MENWKDLWKQNYEGKGDCEKIHEAVKSLTFGSKKDATYLPWAIPVRIFKLQDGEYEVLEADENSIVFIDKCIRGYEIADANGVTNPIYNNSFFIRVKAVWKGKEHIEKYPLQNNNGQALTTWTQNELHKNTQRAIVKAIAIVSGIGYKLFEDGDLQFEESATEKLEKVEKERQEALAGKIRDEQKLDPKTDKKPKKEEVQKTVITPSPTTSVISTSPTIIETTKNKVEEVAVSPVVVEVKTPVIQSESIVAIVKVEEEEEIVQEKPAKQVDNLFSEELNRAEKIIVQKPDISNKPRIELENDLKTIFMQSGGTEKGTTIKSFLKSKNVKKLSELEEKDLQELYAKVN